MSLSFAGYVKECGTAEILLGLPLPRRCGRVLDLPIDDLHRPAQLPAGRGEDENVVHEAHV